MAAAATGWMKLEEVLGLRPRAHSHLEFRKMRKTHNRA